MLTILGWFVVIMFILLTLVGLLVGGVWFYANYIYVSPEMAAHGVEMQRMMAHSAERMRILNDRRELRLARDRARLTNDDAAWDYAREHMRR